MEVRKLMKSLKPMELFDIITQGICDNYKDRIKEEIIDLNSEWHLDNWPDTKLSNRNKSSYTIIKIDILILYLTDTHFKLYTTEEEAIRISNEFKSLDLFHNVGYKWYSQNTYTVGFNYTQEDFRVLYTKWIRNKMISNLGI